MKVGSYVEIETRGSSLSKSFGIIVRETNNYWYVGEREIKFSKKDLLSTWYYSKIREITEDDYNLAIAILLRKKEEDIMKIEIMDTLSNPYYFKEISYEKLQELHNIVCMNN